MSRYTIRGYKYGDTECPMSKLQDLENKIEDGVLVELPCKVGDKVWLVFSPKYPANPADKGKWFMEQDGVQRILYGAKGFSIETWNMGNYHEKKICKTVFLTREEAEKALTERKEHTDE